MKRKATSATAGDEGRSGKSSSGGSTSAVSIQVSDVAAPANVSESTALTFGVEFEFILAFTEPELVRLLVEYSISSRIVKDPIHLNHANLLNQTEFSNRRFRYPSWGLEVLRSEIVALMDDLKYNSSNNINYVRRLSIEPLIIAKKALEAQNNPVDVIKLIDNQRTDRTNYSMHKIDNVYACAPADYTKWTLTEDHSLIGATKRELQRLLPTLITKENVNIWDSAGVELISPVFNYDNRVEVCKEIHQYLAGVKHQVTSSPNLPTSESDSQSYAAFDSVWAGTHVHIGFDLDQMTADKALSFLQHLVFLVLVHEPLLSGIHPTRRRGFKVGPAVSSNTPDSITPIPPSGFNPPQPLPGETPTQTEARVQADEERHVEAISAAYMTEDNLISNLQHFITNANLGTNTPTLGLLAQKIFDKQQTMTNLAKDFHAAGNHPRKVLVWLGNLVKALDQKDPKNRSKWATEDDLDHAVIGKATIEFRQHGCTLDAAEIKHWVDFLFALVRLAERMAAVAPATGSSAWDAEARKYPVDLDDTVQVGQWSGIAIEEFCGPSFLSLPDNDIRYWKQRYDYYANPATANTVGPRTRKTRTVRNVKSRADRAERTRWVELVKFLGT